MPDICAACQGTGSVVSQSPTNPHDIIIGPCPECSATREVNPGEPGWHLKLTFKRADGQLIERGLLSVSGTGEIKLKEPLTLKELMVVVDKGFNHGLLWQALVITMSELRRVQDRLAALEARVGE